MTTALLADDEPNLLTHLQQLLSRAWPELDIIGATGSGREALALAATRQPDIAFLDIRMPGLNGLEVAERLPPGTRVVFVTAYDQHAVEAFERQACDYLLKPVTPERLAQTVARLRTPQGDPAPDMASVLAALESVRDRLEGSSYLRWLRVRRGDATELVPVDEVVYFKAEAKYTSLFTAEGERLIRTPLKDLEAQLDPAGFWRVHRGLIVRVAAIERARPDFRGRYELTLRGRPETLRSSAAFGHLFRQM